MQEYFPRLILNICDIQERKKRYAIVVLNRPISLDKELIINLWNHSSIKVTVDGGTNRWLSWIRDNNLENKLPHPNLITGDFDSIHADSIKYFNTTTKVIKTLDQDETDFTKCLRVLEPLIKEMSLDFIVCICENSGRLDHILANLNTLFKNQLKSSDLLRPVYLLSSTALSWLLPVGQNTIHIPEHVRNYWCSLVPIGQSCVVTSSGLKWNLKNHVLEFGGIVSTSNKYDGESETVFVATDKPLLWSMGIKSEDD